MPDEGGQYSLLSDCLAVLGASECDGQNFTLHDRVQFIEAAHYNYNEIAALYHCKCDMSARRLGEAYDYWQEDIARTLKNGIESPSETLDHFKHASFIAFWLRRMIPVNDLWNLGPVPVDRRAANENFMRFGNEICALFIGFQLCLFYEDARIEAIIASDNSLCNRRFGKELVKTVFPPHLMTEFSMILKHKNMSPYAIYLLYKSLFNTSNIRS
jgi:hypothetical protein